MKVLSLVLQTHCQLLTRHWPLSVSRSIGGFVDAVVEKDFRLASVEHSSARDSPAHSLIVNISRYNEKQDRSLGWTFTFKLSVERVFELATYSSGVVLSTTDPQGVGL